MGAAVQGGVLTDGNIKNVRKKKEEVLDNL